MRVSVVNVAPRGASVTVKFHAAWARPAGSASRKRAGGIGTISAARVQKRPEIPSTIS
jgi:hypothetical protein